MELLYNPDSMPEEEVKATFVARQWLVDEVCSLIKRQPDGAGVQHILIIAPRGMGKTTVLLMAKFAINDGNLSKRWHAVKFPEESYGVYDLADFWLEVLNIVAADTNDEQLQKQVEDLRSSFPGNNDLQEAALALIKDWRRKHKKRLVLLVDNIDMILEQINDERDEARLRDVLMNDGAMMIVGCAISFFDEARSYEKPLYNFFKTYDLAKLKFDQIQELLLRRAELDGIQGFEETLKANKSRLRVLEYFTGGNPRLVLMLYRVVTQSDISEVHRGLEKLLDEVTPYFKHKVESLPAQLRKILDQVARVSSKTNEGLTPTDIARAVRLSSNQVSSQLKRLSDMGYVRSANLRSRSSHYVLSEPLYAIWHQMRFGRDARERMQWLVNFIKSYYDSEEMGAESVRLELRFRELLAVGRMPEAHDVLDHHRYLAQAMDDSITRAGAIDDVIRGYVDICDIDTLRKEVLPGLALEALGNGTLFALYEAGCITDHEIVLADSTVPLSEDVQRRIEIAKAMNYGATALEGGREKEALQHLDRLLQLVADEPTLWSARGALLGNLGDHEAAITSFDRALEIDPNVAQVWVFRGDDLRALRRHDEAIASFDRALELDPNDARVWKFRGNNLSALGRYEEAIVSYDNSLKINGKQTHVWIRRSAGLDALNRNEAALASIDRAIEVDPASSDAWFARGKWLVRADRHEEALASLDRAAKINPNRYDVWLARGTAFVSLSQLNEAIGCLDRALQIMDGHPMSESSESARWAAHLMKFAVFVCEGKFGSAKKEWHESLGSAKPADYEQGIEPVSHLLFEFAKVGDLAGARALIAEAGLDERLFPMARAIDYILSGDEALIEKLSPEIRGIVEEIVVKLRSAADQSNPRETKTRRTRRPSIKKSNTEKKKSAPRSRARRQLS
jgi:tetratricopeptide (TPR) repeat protein